MEASLTISQILVSLKASLSILFSLKSISISTLCFNKEGAFSEHINSPFFLPNSLVSGSDDLSDLKELALILKTVHGFLKIQSKSGLT